jgi:thioredoxin-like negative regulator of GroEL
MVAPVMEELSVEYAGKVNFYKINTDVEQELGSAFGIRSIPSLLFVPKEGQPKMAVGALPKESLKQAIQEELLTATA